MDSERSGDPSAIADRIDEASATVGEFRRSFVATPYWPTGPTGSTEALAFLVEELDWLLSFASPTRGRTEDLPAPCREENREVMAAAVAVLHVSAANLDGERLQPDLDRLDWAREAVARALVQQVADLRSPRDEIAQPAALEPSFRRRELPFAAREVGVNALRASGAAAPEATQPLWHAPIAGRADEDRRAGRDQRFRPRRGLSSRTSARGRHRFATACAEPRGSVSPS